MRNRVLVKLLGWALLVLAATTAKPVAAAGDLVQGQFAPSYFAAMSFAKFEMEVDFAGSACVNCNARVVEARYVPAYVNVDSAGYSGDKLDAIRRAIAGNQGRALVLTRLPSARTGRIENLVLLPLPQQWFDQCPEVTNAALLTTEPQPAGLCGLRTFGFKGQGSHCGVCAIGICCGACKCLTCNVFTDPSAVLDVPARFDRLLYRFGSLDEFPLNVDLVARY